MIHRVSLTLLIGPVVAVPVPPAVMDAFVSAQVTVTAGQRSGFQLAFTVSRRSLLSTTLLPAGYFDPGIRVILVATVDGVPEPLVDGLVTRQEVAVSDSVGQSVLTVTGEDVSVAMDLVKLKGVPQPPGPAFARVALVLAPYAVLGMVPVTVPEIFPDIALPTEKLEMKEGTDLEYVTNLAKKNGYVFYVEPGPVPGASIAYWGPEIRVGLPQPALNVDFDAGSNVSSLSFGFDGLQRATWITTIQEPTTRIPIPIPVPGVDPLRPPLALKPAPTLRVEMLDGSAKKTPTEALAEAVARASESADAVTGQGQLDVARYGHVLRARRLVGVRGAGPAFDGLYFVKNVTSTLKRGEFTQSFSLARNGLIPLTPEVLP